MIGTSEINGFHPAVGRGARIAAAVSRRNETGSRGAPRRLPVRRDELPTVREFTVSPAVRLAHAVASASIVRDAAALGAVILFATMLAMVLVGMDPSA
jgi:hypothetical protein